MNFSKPVSKQNNEIMIPNEGILAFFRIYKPKHAIWGFFQNYPVFNTYVDRKKSRYKANMVNFPACVLCIKWTIWTILV